MKLEHVSISKIFKYEYENIQEKEEHKQAMIMAKLGIVHEDGLIVIYNQIIK